MLGLPGCSTHPKDSMLSDISPVKRQALCRRRGLSEVGENGANNQNALPMCEVTERKDLSWFTVLEVFGRHFFLPSWQGEHTVEETICLMPGE